MTTPFNQKELPAEAFKQIGLYQKNAPTLTKADLDALLAGRRTDLIAIENLKTNDFTIKHLDAKLSLSKDKSGAVELLIHPIHKEVKKHELLSELESEQLISGKFTHVEKEVTSNEGKPKSLIVEYDAQTKEFVSYDPETVIGPDKINGQQLSAQQKDSFRKGDVVELPDGTKVQHKASDKSGILSDNKMLVLSVLLDGGISYMLLRGLKNLAENHLPQKEQTEEFEKALQEMKTSSPESNASELNHLKQQNRGYSNAQAR